MDSNLGYIMTVSNSIIGVSILAMPYCFKQCGILLAIVMLIVSNIISRLTCHFLLKSAIMSRRRTFELLAFHTFGTTGKFMVELGIIGFLMGTCTAFFVIIGDLGPAIIAKMLDIKSSDTLRTYILISVALFCVLPLGLLRNVDSLNSVSTATIGFYFCLVLKTVFESERHFKTGDWLSRVEFWQPNGILQCLPIFAMAMSCQTQLFEIYETLPNASLDKMNYIVRIAVNICVCVYICVGFFGYVAFATQPFTGNILMSFSPSWMTDTMKMGFVLSVAFSFPLVIFPCRASLYSLLFKKGHAPYEGVHNFIPESKFKVLTMLIVGISLVIGLLIPNIEVVLGLVGSTIGTLICIIFPVICFICISTKNTNERLLAQFLLFIGVIVMVMGTYSNIYAMEGANNIVTEKVETHDVLKNLLKDGFEKNLQANGKDKAIDGLQMERMVRVKPGMVRLEPPQPVEPRDTPVLNEKVKEEAQLEGVIVKPLENVNGKSKPVSKKLKISSIDRQIVKKVEEVDVDAIKKEDKELLEAEKDKLKEDEKKKIELLEIINKNKKEQESLLKEQQKILTEIRKEKELKVEENVVDKIAEMLTENKVLEKDNVKLKNVVEDKQKGDEKKSELLEIINKNKKEQESLLKEQKDIFTEMKKEKELKVQENVVNEIAKKVIENIVLKKDNNVWPKELKNEKKLESQTRISDKVPLSNIQVDKKVLISKGMVPLPIMLQNELLKLNSVSATDKANTSAVIEETSALLKSTQRPNSISDTKQSEDAVSSYKKVPEKGEKQEISVQENKLVVDVPVNNKIIKTDVNDQEVKKLSMPSDNDNVKSIRRDILAKTEVTENELVRVKRETDFEQETFHLVEDIEMKNCDKTDAPPLIKSLITELSNDKNLFKLEHEKVIAEIKHVIKSNTFNLKRK